MSKDNFDIHNWKMYQLFLNEQDEEDFNVEDIPAYWNQTELKQGMVYNEKTGEVWPDLKSVPREFKNKNSYDAVTTYEITSLSKHYITITRVINRKQTYQFPTEYFNEVYGSLINSYVPTNINESDDEDFNVEDIPKYWSNNDLKVGDTITPDMWNHNINKNKFLNSWNNYLEKDLRNENWTINNVYSSNVYNNIGKGVIVVNMVNQKGDTIYGRVNEFNKLLKKYQIVLPLSESDDEDFNVEDVPGHWNVKELSDGDFITHDMWNPKIGHYSLYVDTTKPCKIQIHKSKVLNDISVVLTDPENRTDVFDLDSLNQNYLKPEYQIVPPTNLNESDEDFDVQDVPQHWNVDTLTVGDYITPDMFRDDFKLKNSWKTLKEKPYEILGFGNDYEGPYVELMWEDNPINIDLDELNDDLLKPEYQVVSSLFESDEEDFNVEDVPQHWNVEPLKFGDKITPDMWDKKPLYTDIDFNDTYEILGFDTHFDWDNPEEEVIVVFLKGLKDPDDIQEYLPNINMWLKPTYQVYPYNLYESEEEDFNVEDVPGHWNEFDGNISVTFKSKVGYVYVSETDEEEFEHLNPGIHTRMSYDDEPVYVFQTFKTNPFPIEIIQEDFELPPFTHPLTLQHFEEWIGNDIDYLEEIVYDRGINVEVLSTSYTDVNFNPVKVTKKMSQYFDHYDEFQNDSIVDVQFLDNLNENEEEDFNVEDIPGYWNPNGLSIGDKITPDMWDEQPWFVKNRTFKIDNIYKYNNKLKVDTSDILSPSNSFPFDINNINQHLKPEFQVSTNYLSESDDDEFNVEDVPQHWNITELGVGDTIKGKMWDWKKIINTINREHGDDHEGVNRDIEMWKRVYDEGVTIKSFSTKGDTPWIDVGDDLLGWGPSVWYINKLLSPGYEVKVPLKESEDEFDVEDVPEHWNEIELGKGDIITPEMMGTSGDSYYKIGDFDKNKVTIYKGTMLHRQTGDVFVPNTYSGVKFPISSVQHRLVKGYRLNPNKITLSELLGY